MDWTRELPVSLIGTMLKGAMAFPLIRPEKSGACWCEICHTPRSLADALRCAPAIFSVFVLCSLELSMEASCGIAQSQASCSSLSPR